MPGCPHCAGLADLPPVRGGHFQPAPPGSAAARALQTLEPQRYVRMNHCAATSTPAAQARTVSTRPSCWPLPVSSAWGWVDASARFTEPCHAARRQAGAWALKSGQPPATMCAGRAGSAGHLPWLSVAAERAVSQALGGSCSMPAWPRSRAGVDQTLRIDAAWGGSGPCPDPCRRPGQRHQPG